jgi:hypothetical protein
MHSAPGAVRGATSPLGLKGQRGVRSQAPYLAQSARADARGRLRFVPAPPLNRSASPTSALGWRSVEAATGRAARRELAFYVSLGEPSGLGLIVSVSNVMVWVALTGMISSR